MRRAYLAVKQMRPRRSTYDFGSTKGLREVTPPYTSPVCWIWVRSYMPPHLPTSQKSPFRELGTNLRCDMCDIRKNYKKCTYYSNTYYLGIRIVGGQNNLFTVREQATARDSLAIIFPRTVSCFFNDATAYHFKCLVFSRNR